MKDVDKCKDRRKIKKFKKREKEKRRKKDVWKCTERRTERLNGV